jgi:signal transduction histidine kinase
MADNLTSTDNLFQESTDLLKNNANFHIYNGYGKFAQTGQWEYNLNTDTLWGSYEAKMIFGFNDHSADFVIAEIEKCIPQNEETRLALVELIEKEKYNLEFEIITKDNSESKIVWCFAEIKKDKNGNPESIVGVIQDIAEKKKYENNLQTTFEQLRKFSVHVQDVMEDERVTLSREIQENIGQKLKDAKLDLEAINDKDSLDSILKIVSLIDEALSSAKSIIGGLRVEEIKLLGFIESAKMLVNNLIARYNITIELNDAVGLLNLEPNQTIALYRILQEALTNVVLHSSATNVSINLAEIDEKLVLEIEDNGIGFSPKNIKNDKFGIIGMKQRAAVLNATLSVKSILGKGTIVKVEMH